MAGVGAQAATSRTANLKDATREVEQIKAFRDTWEYGIHSYLTYLRDRLTVAKELLTESGSIFVQIGSRNVSIHGGRELESADGGQWR